jgi:hypothetical protein
MSHHPDPISARRDSPTDHNPTHGEEEAPIARARFRMGRATVGEQLERFEASLADVAQLIECLRWLTLQLTELREVS